MKRLLHCILLAGAVLGTASAHAQFNGPADTAADPVNSPHVLTTDPAILYPARHDNPMHSGDMVHVSIYTVGDYGFTGRVSEEGFLSVPLIDPVQVEGLTIREVQTLLAQRFEAAQIFHNAPVQIEVTESVRSQITLMGDVRGQVSGVAGSRRLFDVLASVGGLQPTTSHVITIDRPGMAQSINVDLGTDPEHSKFANVPVFPGDTIMTGRIGSYYLVGAWKTQGAFPIQNTAPLTLLQAYTIGNGKFLEGKANELHLIRTVGTTRTLTIVKMDKVLKGQEPDPVLQGDDILYLPSNKVLAAIRGGGVNTAIGLALTLAYAIPR
ncbi:polysaccharide biosynthesis/export family protein [Terriglobus aquaticus]|uniref:Polysaccharide biosynthesis/export family protein n=1 Tax=Terriglobus aquaticus TaxID=940139 RepID=A0ABW9KIK5_9BACT|nr:polysaccharide biosynthesis/export family protein [Terriglobus aquaticus]